MRGATGDRGVAHGATALAALAMCALAAGALDWPPAAEVVTRAARSGEEASAASGDPGEEQATAREPEVGEAAPGFALSEVGGGRVALEDLRGRKPVLLVVWATWCPPCIQEFAELKRLHSTFSVDGLEILAVGVRYEETREAVRAFARDMEVRFPVLYDETSEVVSQYGISVIPTNFLIDRRGIIRFKSNGLSPDLEQHVRAVLGGA